MDLLDLLAEQGEHLDLQVRKPPPPDTRPNHGRHVLLPNMAYACGGNILSKAGGFVVGPRPWDQVTCPECRAFGHEVLSAECDRMQGRQA